MYIQFQKLPWLLLALFLLPINIYCQNYLKESSKWSTLYIDTYDQYYIFSRYQINGDTTIQDTSYYKVHHEFDLINLDPQTLDTIDNYMDVVRTKLLRESGGKFYSRSDGGDYLVADFNLDVGSTINEGQGEHIVQSIEFFDFYGEQRKLFTTNTGLIIYEGIGVNKDLFGGLYDFNHHASGTIRCYYENNVPLELPYSQGIAPQYHTECEDVEFQIISSTEVPGEVEPRVRIYPNPFREGFELAVNVTDPGMLNITLYDAQGNLLDVLFDGVVGQGSFTVQVKELEILASGIYFLKVTTPKSIDIQHLIKS